jgi:large subunit ribosomal protein L17
MRHRKDTQKLGKTGSHVRCMLANMLKSLIEHGRIETTIPKAKALRRDADKMITLAKKNTIHAKRLARGYLMVRYNPLSPKEKREAKKGKIDCYNTDRKVINRLFGELREKFLSRNGGYTRIIKKSDFQRGDNAAKCYIEYVE